MTLRTVKAYSKATHTISKLMMHGNLSTFDKGYECIVYCLTDKSDAELIDIANSECAKLGLELWKVYIERSKATSFSTSATWCGDELYRDDNRASYFEGVFDGEGNKIEG